MSGKATRSPNSPSRPLGSCYQDAMQLFDAFPNAVFDQQQIASTLGFSSGSGAFKGLVSDLKQYGLIESKSEGDYVISDDLKDLILAEEGEKDWIKYRLATKPKVFMQVIENQGRHLPNATTLESVLVARFGFNKAKAAKTAKALRGSLEWANAIDEKGNVLSPSAPREKLADVNGEPAFSENGTGAENVNVSTVGLADGADGFRNERASYMRPQEGCLTTDVPIGDGRVVHVEYPQDMTADEAKKVCAVLGALTGPMS